MRNAQTFRDGGGVKWTPGSNTNMLSSKQCIRFVTLVCLKKKKLEFF